MFAYDDGADLIGGSAYIVRIESNAHEPLCILCSLSCTCVT